MKILVDTCVVIDFLQARQPFYGDADTLFTAIANHKADAYLTAKSLSDIYYLMKRYFHDERETRRMLSSLLIVMELLDTAAVDCRMAIASDTPDFEDAIMIETAVRSGMDCIVTRNQKDYSKSRLPVYSPAELLTLIEK